MKNHSKNPFILIVCLVALILCIILILYLELVKTLIASWFYRFTSVREDLYPRVPVQ